jgi:hypothetical protein
MCDPQMAVYAQGAGAAASTVGSYYAAKGQQIAAKSQANLDDINARMADNQARDALVQGQQEEQNIKLKTAQVKGSQKAAIAANGIDISDAGVGTTVNNILSSTEVMGQTDANTTRANAVKQAWGYKMQGVNYRNDALMQRTTAKSISPWMQAGGTLLTSAASVAATKYKLEKDGAKFASWKDVF